jgi:hypothetical protein
MCALFVIAEPLNKPRNYQPAWQAIISNSNCGIPNVHAKLSKFFCNDGLHFQIIWTMQTAWLRNANAPIAGGYSKQAMAASGALSAQGHENKSKA